MKNINVQCEIDDCQKNEKIEDLCPCVCTSTRENAPTICLVFSLGTWGFWKNVLNTRYSALYHCFWSQNNSYSSDSGSWNVASIIVPRCSSSNALNLSKDDPGELCSEGWVPDWVPDGSGMGWAGCSSSSTSSSTSPLSGLSW